MDLFFKNSVDMEFFSYSLSADLMVLNRRLQFFSLVDTFSSSSSCLTSSLLSIQFFIQRYMERPRNIIASMDRIITITEAAMACHSKAKPYIK